MKTQKEIVALEKFFSHRTREVVEELSFAFAIFFLSFSVLFAVPALSHLGVLWPVFQGLFLVSLSVLLMTLLLEVYFQSLYARLRRQGISLAVALIKDRTAKRRDTVASFFDFAWGKDLTKRLGIADEQLRYFLKQKEPRIIDPARQHQLHTFGDQLYQEDYEFQKFLEGIMVGRDHFVEVLKLVEEGTHYRLQSRIFLYPVFSQARARAYSFGDIVRLDIEDLEYVYHVHFTEKAIQDVISHFADDRLGYIDSASRKEFLSGLIERAVADHQELSHGRRTILPSDARKFIISHKAGKL